MVFTLFEDGVNSVQVLPMQSLRINTLFLLLE
jgi:hypothetical protein